MSTYIKKYFNDADTAEKLLRLHIATYRYAAKICDEICKTSKRFDGKVVNARFEKAMCEDTGEMITIGQNHIMEDHTKDFYIKMYIRDRSVSGECPTHYIMMSEVYLCSVYDKDIDTALIVNKRLVADRLIKELQDKKEKLLADADNLEESIDKVSRWKERFVDLTNEMVKLHDEIPYEVMSYYGMEVPY